jgi:hypothetical protein
VGGNTKSDVVLNSTFLKVKEGISLN